MRGRWIRPVVRGSLAALMMGSLLAPGPLPLPAQPVAGTAEIKTLAGRVEILRKGQSQWQPALAGARLFEGDDIRAHGGASAELGLPDTSALFLAENSRLRLARLDFDSQQQRRLVLAHLAVGKVRAVVAPAAVTLVRVGQAHFAVSTPTALASARGTTTWISYNPGPNTTAMAVEPEKKPVRKGLIDCIPLVTPVGIFLIPAPTQITEGFTSEDCGPPFPTPPAFLSFFNPFPPGGPFSGPVTVPSQVFTVVAALSAPSTPTGGGFTDPTSQGAPPSTFGQDLGAQPMEQPTTGGPPK